MSSYLINYTAIVRMPIQMYREIKLKQKQSQLITWFLNGPDRECPCSEVLLTSFSFDLLEEFASLLTSGNKFYERKLRMVTKLQTAHENTIVSIQKFWKMNSETQGSVPPRAS